MTWIFVEWHGLHPVVDALFIGCCMILGRVVSQFIYGRSGMERDEQ
ncbi:MAG: hypothetical protein K6T83_14330 [Alicyclobacillus sp.]|nr:hypothetical protein [Alicyclobacillus sp.]